MIVNLKLKTKNKNCLQGTALFLVSLQAKAQAPAIVEIIICLPPTERCPDRGNLILAATSVKSP
ncbi:MAG: hypothetical protein SCALA702_32360 [Melioribacteraceae bacterium]|nr:MAG: hypothetical protein SCALA702_32360 [Melioribacteraceae bacterium]